MHILTAKLSAPLEETEASARAFLTELVAQQLDYHFDDGPHDCLRDCGLTDKELDVIDMQVRQLYAMDIFDGEDCPIGLLLQVQGHKSEDENGNEIPWSWTNAQTKGA